MKKQRWSKFSSERNFKKSGPKKWKKWDDYQSKNSVGEITKYEWAAIACKGMTFEELTTLSKNAM